jgi:hypothetical protein
MPDERLITGRDRTVVVRIDDRVHAGKGIAGRTVA